MAIIGRSGSGKSTLLRCINGLEHINRAASRWRATGSTPARRGLRELRKDVGIVFQSYNLFPHLTVGENITLAPRMVLEAERRGTVARSEGGAGQVGLAESFDA